MNPIVHYVLHKKYYKEILCVNRNIPGNCCEGKCQLKKEIADAEKSQDRTPAIPIPKLQTENLFFCLLKNPCVDLLLKVKSESLISYIDPLPKIIYLNLLTPPPKK
jgi:hypothetical protein